MNELDKWSEVFEKSVTINEFFDFLSSKGITLGKMAGDCGQIYLIHSPSLKDLIYEYFKINPAKLERERRELIDSCHD